MSSCVNALGWTQPSVHTPIDNGGKSDPATVLSYGDVVTLSIFDKTGNRLIVQWGYDSGTYWLTNCDMGVFTEQLQPNIATVQVTLVNASNTSAQGTVYDGDAVYLAVNTGNVSNSPNGGLQECSENGPCNWGTLSKYDNGIGQTYLTYYDASSTDVPAYETLFYLRNMSLITNGTTTPDNPQTFTTKTPLTYGSPVGIGYIGKDSSSQNYFVPGMGFLLDSYSDGSGYEGGDIEAFSVYFLGTSFQVPSTFDPVQTSCTTGGGGWTCSSSDKNCTGSGSTVSCPADSPCPITCDPTTCICTCPTTCASQPSCPAQIDTTTCLPNQCNQSGCINGNINPTCNTSLGLYDCTGKPASSTAILVVAGVVAGIILFLSLLIVLVVKLFGSKSSKSSK